MLFQAQRREGNPRNGMRVLLRDTQTGWYYQEPSKWTPEPEAAHDLKHLPLAVKLACEAHLENVEIFMGFDDPQFNLVLPLSRSQS